MKSAHSTPISGMVAWRTLNPRDTSHFRNNRMLARIPLLALSLMTCLASTACGPMAHHSSLLRETGGAAALYGQIRIYHGNKQVNFEQMLAACRRSDVILFGEQHEDTVCAQVEAQLLASLSMQRRPIALAMEFIESDTQSSLNGYLSHRISETDFVHAARQSSAYRMCHRPLISWCRSRGISVIAANAPRSLVRKFRQSGLSYAEFRATLTPSQQTVMPVELSNLHGAYRDRFFGMMSGIHDNDEKNDADHTESVDPKLESFFQAQLLWDESMSDSVANHRRRHRGERVMLIVGGFHVTNDGGTTRKLHAKRPRDRMVTIGFESSSDWKLPRPDDANLTDFTIVGMTAPPRKSSKPADATHEPSSKPASQPSSQPSSPHAPHHHMPAPASQPSASPHHQTPKHDSIEAADPEVNTNPEPSESTGQPDESHPATSPTQHDEPAAAGHHDTP